ncbi:MAG: hypothetical protein LBI14_01465 [Treponema sp.]|nr:hypothetical protein [Treponema sp.]
MTSLIIGFVVLVAAVLAALPQEIIGFGLGWWSDVVPFLRGSLPVIAILTGLIMMFIGFYGIWCKPRPSRKVVVEEASGE